MLFLDFNTFYSNSFNYGDIFRMKILGVFVEVEGLDSKLPFNTDFLTLKELEVLYSSNKKKSSLGKPKG